MRRRMAWASQLAVLTLTLVQFTTETPAQDRDSTFAHLITSRTRETFGAIRQYLREHPDATDRQAAEDWLLKTAREWGLEADVLESAAAASEHQESDVNHKQLALSVLAVAQGRQGDGEAAVAAFDRYLSTLRLRNPNSAIDLAMAIAVPLQLRGDISAANAVYDRLSAGFFLNPEVREVCSARKDRLELVGKPAPPITPSDLMGEPFTWEGLRGKIVVIDFWATNCRPCLEELPRLRRLHQDYRPRGCEFVGISLDEEAATIERFRESTPIPWRIVLDQSQVTPEYRVKLIPCVILVDPQGRIAATDVPPSELRAALETLLAGTASK